MHRVVSKLICFSLIVFMGQNASAQDVVSMPALLEEYQADRDSVQFKYRVPFSSVANQRWTTFYDTWQNRLDGIDFESLNQDGKVDYVLFKNELNYQKQAFEINQRLDQEAAEIIPQFESMVSILQDREDLVTIDGRATAEQLHALTGELQKANGKVEAYKAAGRFSTPVAQVSALRTSEMLDRLRRSFRSWFDYYDGYDPLFSWWNKEPYAEFDRLLEQYSNAVRSQLAGIDRRDNERIVGQPIGSEALLLELQHAMIPYSPEELVKLAEEQFAWCDTEMDKAAAELGYDDWAAAQEYVKTLHVEPGRQTDVIRDMAWEAIAFIEERDLVTVPALCKESWRMEMMAPERQKVSPFFLGGPTIIVSYPTDTMSHPDKLMSMRGNNSHFSRATVQHELIPGHHLQAYMTKRHRAYRQMFSTPFWIEGWALYWEMLLWDEAFPQSAEDKIGMLFWRKHRCARIIFSLNYHLGKMTPEECVDYLVQRVGHERANAAAEVRRSIMGGYGPLYQAAYMLGGLQIRAMYNELVASGVMTPKQFHDAILRENSIPIEMLRAKLTNQPLTPDYQTQWRFYD